MIKQSGMSKEIIERLGGVTGCVSIALGIGSSCFFYFLEEETLVSSLTYAVLASSLSYCVVYTIVSIFISDEVQENIILTKERDRLLNENEEILKRIKEAKDSLHKNIVRRSIKSVAYQMTIHNKRGDTSFKKVTKIVPKEPLKLIVGSIKTSSKNKFLFFDKKRGLKANIIYDKGDKVSCITFPIEVENQRTQYIVIFPVLMENEFQLEITYT